MRKRLSKTERLQVFNKYDGKCAYCGIELSSVFHVDHAHPVHRGGSCEMENLMPACKRCNLWKKTFTVDEFRGEIQMQIRRLFERSAQFNLAYDYGLIQKTNAEVEFYFEGLTNA